MTSPFHDQGVEDVPSRHDMLFLDPQFRRSLDRLTRLASHALGTPVAGIRVAFDGDLVPLCTYPQKQESPATTGDPTRCREVVRTGTALLVPDVREHPTAHDHSASDGAGMLAYAGVPLPLGDPRFAGTLFVADFQPHPWTDRDLESLHDLASLVVREVVERIDGYHPRRSESAKEGTETKCAAAARVVSENQYQVLFETSPLPMWALDRETFAFLAVNDAAVAHYGYSRSEFLSMTALDIRPTSDAEGFLQWADHSPSGYASVGPVRHQKKNGDLIQVEITVHMTEFNGRAALLAVVYDVTTRRQREENRRAAHERLERQVQERTKHLTAERAYLHAVIENAPGLVFAKDAEGRFVLANRAFAELYGTTPPELLGRADAGFTLKSAEADHFRRIERELLAGGQDEVAVEEGVANARTGETRWLHTRMVRFVPPGEDSPQILGMSTDITERKRVERALELSEERYRLMVEDSDDVFFYLHDTEGRFEYVSPSVRKILGYHPDELIGQSYRVLLTGDASDEEVDARTEAGLGGKVVGTYTALTRHRDGPCVPVELTEVAVRRNGVLVGMHGFARNISQRDRAEQALKMSEARFRAVIENSTEVLTILDRDGTILYQSPAIQKILGYAPDELLDTSALSLVHPDDLETTRKALETIVEGEVPVTTEFRFRHRDGSFRVLESTGTNLLGEPAVSGVVVNSRDVTELRRSEEQLRQSQRLEAIGLLTRGIAHDFNNILHAVRGNTNLLLMDLPKESRMREEALEIQSGTERAAELTKQLLAFSRQQILRPQVLDVSVAVANMSKMLQRLVGKDVCVETHLAANLGQVEVDPGQLEQILVHLASNARDAMPAGGVLSIEAQNSLLDAEDVMRLPYQVSPGAYVRLTVRDTGAGMPLEVQKRIFEPFFTTKEVGKGSGLGLATTYGIVKQSGGHIWVESEPGAGSAFHVYLPQTRCEAASIDDGTSELLLTPSDSCTVLLVEDDPAVRSVTRRTLERFGHRVLVARDGTEAIRLAGEHGGALDLLLTDVVMPRLSGRELAEQLTPRHPRMRVLFMSGYTDDATLRLGVSRDEVNFLAKPFDPMDLAEKIHKLMREDGRRLPVSGNRTLPDAPLQEPVA